MFDAVIFDLDGTLVDTERLTLAAGIEAFARQGVAVDPAFLHGLVGKDDVTGAGLIRTAFPQIDLAAYDADWTAATDRLSAGGLPLKPGVLDLLDLLGGLDLPRAIATSSTRRQADRKLARSGLSGQFRHVVVLEDVARPKPAPDPYLLAAERLGAAPARCLAFEDSETGAMSARAAGMTVVQVPDLLPASGRHAHLVAPDILSGARGIGLISG
jgi:HAD superfamily hydrolase (TIGR01509 family)